MKPFSIASVLLAFCAFGIQAANPVAAQMRTQMANQMHHQMMMQQLHSSSMYTAETMSANVASFFTVYAKDSVSSGYGALQTEKPSMLRGTKRRSLIELDGQRFMPGFTDSVHALDAYGKTRKGIPHGENWIFIVEAGRITAYSDVPGGEVAYASIAGGELLSLAESKEKTRFEKELRTVPLAAYFAPAPANYDPMASRGSESGESPLIPTAVKYYNHFHAKNAVPATPVRLDGAVARLFSVDSISEYGMADVKLTDPDDFMQMSVRAKYLCSKGNYAEADPLIAKLDAMIPDFYANYQIKGLCAQARGDLKRAQSFYHQAYKYAPPRSGLLESYYRKIQKYEKALAEKPGQ